MMFHFHDGEEGLLAEELMMSAELSWGLLVGEHMMIVSSAGAD